MLFLEIKRNRNIAVKDRFVFVNLSLYLFTTIWKGMHYVVLVDENIRPIDSIILFATEENIADLFLFTDFEKAFDSLEWSFVRDTLLFSLTSACKFG